MNTDELKTKLLNLGIFADNKYLDDYIDLVISNRATEKQKNTTECHHIIPRVYFRYKKLEIDNSPDNLVNLKYCDHVLAHCLLALAFNDKYMISASIDGIYAVLNSFGLYMTLAEFVVDYPQVKDVLKCNHFISEAQVAIIGERSANSHWYNNGIKERFMQGECPEGWAPGRLKNTASWESTKQKLQQRSSNCRWYNNGTDCTFAQECPDGWKPGRIVTEKLRAANAVRSIKPEDKKKHYVCKTDMRWYHNETSEGQFAQGKQPAGWTLGRSLQTRKTMNPAQQNKLETKDN